MGSTVEEPPCIDPLLFFGILFGSEPCRGLVKRGSRRFLGEGGRTEKKEERKRAMEAA